MQALLVVFHLLVLQAIFGKSEDLLELACTSDQQCVQFARGRCLDNNCYCLARGSGVRVPCSPLEQKLTNIIGGPCPCSQRHAECDSRRDQCICSQGYVPSEDRRRCLPEVVPLAGKCEFSRQCQLADRFSLCQPPENKCLCRTNFEEHQGLCLAVLQSSCREDMDCGRCGASICLPKIKKCGCSEKFVHNRNLTMCISGIAFGEKCEHSPPCQVKLGAGGQCLDHSCSCRATHYPRRMNHISSHTDEEEEPQTEEALICDAIIPYGAYCRNDGDCRMQSSTKSNSPAPSAMTCQWGECQCSENYRLQDDQCIYVESGAGTNLLLEVLMLLSIIVTFCLF
ncbi:hypothetical protein KR074_003724 [Drosophila pseudoananassae]|nr:hypothetical protein KR074_003724 [Drosophila pseudoananassae]